jgi:hypothetical protein
VALFILIIIGALMISVVAAGIPVGRIAAITIGNKILLITIAVMGQPEF